MSTNQHSVDNETEMISKIGKILYLNPDKADVHFIFESSGEHVPAHKNILSTCSDVFDAMFYGALKEEGDIKIVDATAAAFKEFLRFFYFNKVDVSADHVSDVMQLGEKYNVAECRRLCVDLLEANITDENVISTLGLATFYEVEQLQKSCEWFIASNVDKILKSESFLVCDRRVLERILKIDCLPCSEISMFEAIMSWVRAASNEDYMTRDIIQSHLGDFFYELQFGAMTFEEFAKLLPVYGKLFSVNEYSEILQVISGQERKPKIFKACRRLPNWDSTRLMECCRLPSGAYSYTQTHEVTEFSTNTWMLLGYFVVTPIFIPGLIRINKIENVEVTIIANSTEILTSFTCTLDLSSVYNGYKVDLSTPICIQPGTIYEIRIDFPTDEKRTTELISMSSVRIEKDIVVHFHNATNRELIRRLGFNWLICRC